MSHPAMTVKTGASTQKQKLMTETRFPFSLTTWDSAENVQILVFWSTPPNPKPHFSPHGQSPKASKHKKSYRPVYIYTDVFTMH